MVLLVIALSLAVLLTFVIVAFFAATTVNRNVENASSSAVSARMLADGAVGAIEGELIQEIIAGSAPPVPSGNRTIYFPTNATNMVPQRAVYVEQDFGKADYPNFVNVVKQSGQPFFNNAIVFKFTSGAATDTPSGNGRKINPASWSAPMLTGGNFTGSTAPKWIYVNTNGYSATANASTSANPTIGRIAFNVYDIGGLIDINASGHGISITPEVVTSKGTPAATDLTALPGIKPSADRSNLSHSWPPTWRLRGRWEKFQAGSMPFYSRTGWLEPLPRLPPPDTNDADRMFNSRQDLIRYAKAYPETFDQTGTLIPALQYLTTFSRDLEQPSHRPDPARPKVQQAIGAGGNDAQGADDLINPALASQTKADGSAAIKKRFPLSRMELVATPVPPASPSGDAAKILEYFGLTWNNPNNWWVYNHGQLTRILRLSEVPAGREPDLFELLKASLSVGALAKQFGFNFPDTYAVANPASRIGGQDGRIEDQIVQIAANIIDQADPDSYPTRIRFNGRTFYGIEDLPRIYRGHEASYAMGNMPNFGTRFTYNGTVTQSANLHVTMIQPELWNPHRPGVATTGPAPAEFRVVAKTYTPVGVEAAYFWQTPKPPQTPPADIRDLTIRPGPYYSNFSAELNGPNCSQLISYNYGEGSQSSIANASILFNLGSGDAAFREPRPLSAVGYPAGSNARGSVNATDMALTAITAPGVRDNVVQINESAVPPPLNGGNSMTYRSALGFVAGYMPVVPVGGRLSPPSIDDHKWMTIMQGRGGPVSMQLQYKDPSNPSTWWTIDHFEISYANKIRFTQIQSHVANRVDPRSSRWGSLYSTPAGWPDYPGAPWGDASYTMYRFHTGATATPSFSSFPIPTPIIVNWPLTTSYTASQAPGWTGFSAPAQIGILQANSPSSAARYTDPDGVLRGGDARYAASGNAPGWPMLTGNNDSRPVVLNRPFRSVAELGNVFRDTPWRNLDFMSPESGDRALLDVFCVNETPEDTLVAGKVNLNTRQIPVGAALIRGASLATGSLIDQATANSAAAMLVDWTRPAPIIETLAFLVMPGTMPRLLLLLPAGEGFLTLPDGNLAPSIHDQRVSQPTMGSSLNSGRFYPWGGLSGVRALA